MARGESAEPAKGGSVSLPLLGGTGRPRSKIGRWRAAVLIAVHVVIVIHVALWLLMGSTLSPVEPSESMATLELGVVNAGFIFFVLAILSTLIFGRFFCGWGCHVVALQDLCAWAMRKMRARPKPFRSRLLVLTPLVLGLYMFVWPTFKRVALVPAMDAAGIAIPVWIGEPTPFHGFQSELIVEDFWATFPPWYVAIPFLGICGFASVYFLGSKGFCTYGCPYGGIFGVADPVSPGRIVVNDSCDGSGHCTAVCTSNVRVHEEVRDFGAVVDPGCMKCLDCVSACPNDALSFAFAKPAILTRPKDDEAKARREKIKRSGRRYDASLGEEIAIGILGIAFFFAFRGMLNLVPMLMAVGMAGVAAFVVWKAWRTITTPNVRLQSFELRSKGRFRASGLITIASAVILTASAIWSAGVLGSRWLAHMDHEKIEVPIAVALRPEFDPAPEMASVVAEAIDRYERSAPIDQGGFGWTLRPQDRRELAFLYQLEDRTSEAIEQLDLLAHEGRPTDELVAQSIRLRQISGQGPEEIAGALDRIIDLHPDLHEARLERSRLSLRMGTPPAEVAGKWASVIEEGDSPEALLAGATLLTEIGEREGARSAAERAAAHADAGPEHTVRAARVLMSLGSAVDATGLLAGIEDRDVRTPELARSIGTAWATAGSRDRARQTFEAGIERFPESAGLREALGLLSLVGGDADGAIEAYSKAIELTADNPFALAGVGESVVRAGLGSRNQQVYELGVEAMGRAAQESGSAVLHHDFGQALLAAGRWQEGRKAIEAAASITPENAAIAQSLAAIRARLGP